jgi:hypothetical protein
MANQQTNKPKTLQPFMEKQKNQGCPNHSNLKISYAQHMGNIEKPSVGLSNSKTPTATKMTKTYGPTYYPCVNTPI